MAFGMRGAGGLFSLGLIMTLTSLGIFSLAIFACFLASVAGGVQPAAYLLLFSGLFMSVLNPTINSKASVVFRKAEHGTVAGVILFFNCGAAVVGRISDGRGQRQVCGSQVRLLSCYWFCRSALHLSPSKLDH